MTSPQSHLEECEQKMSIKVYKPTTNARRNMSVVDYSELSKVAPERSLLVPLKKSAGRNSYGRITVRHRGGGNRRKYRIIDFKRDKAMPAQMCSLLSMTQTVQLTSPLFNTQMAKRDISLLLLDSK